MGLKLKSAKDVGALYGLKSDQNGIEMDAGCVGHLRRGLIVKIRPKWD